LNMAGDSIREKELRKARNYCSRLLSLCPRTEHEIKARLESRGFRKVIQNDILDLLKKDGLVDDLRFARGWIDSRIRSKPRGVKLLRIELQKKGVGDDVIDRVLHEKAAELDEKAVLREMVKKKIKEVESGPQKNIKGRLFQYVVQKGFDAETAENVINEIMGG